MTYDEQHQQQSPADPAYNFPKVTVFIARKSNPHPTTREYSADWAACLWLPCWLLCLVQVQKPSERVNGTYAVEPPMAKNDKGKPVNAEGKVVKRVMPTDQPLTFWYKRKGYNDFLVNILLCGNAHSPPG